MPNVPLDPEKVQQVKDCVNNLLVALGLNKIDEGKMRGKKYQSTMITILQMELNKVLFTDATPSDAGDQIIAQLKEKFDDVTTSRDTKIKILSILPRTWSPADIQREFGAKASKRMIYTVKNLVSVNGILCDITKKVSPKRISQESVEIVQKFYEDISRACPGIREYLVTHDTNGEKVKIQRRLVLMNLKEAYELFKEEFKDVKIVFSKFASLRPKHCVLAGSTHGIHTTCVCMYHQNPKLTFESLRNQIPLFKEVNSYRDLLGFLQCEERSDKCKLNECQKCPGIYGTEEKPGIHVQLFEFFEKSLIENVTYKQWLNSGLGMRLETVTRPHHEFVDDFCAQLIKLNRHDFIATKQSEYLKNLKNDLKDDEVIALLDFFENLSFDIQNQVQSYYYSKSQCTIHPICLYYKEGNEVQSKSLIFIAESLQHNVNAVYLFQTKLVEYLRRARSNTKKIIFFSDGAASQYKNKKKFLNVCMFEKDFKFKTK